MVDSDQSKLFVGGISRETSEDTLRDHFTKYGAVVGSVVARDRITGIPRGFGFVSFSDSSAVDEALQDTHVILERTVDVKKAVPRGEQQQNQLQNKGLSRNSRGNSRSLETTDQFRTKKIFVGGLAPILTEEEFKNYFEKYGRITDVVVMHDNMTNRPRGFGFITFDSEDSVEEVMQKSYHELSGKFVEVKRAVPKEENTNSKNGYNVRVGSGRDTFKNYHHGYPPYSPGYGIIPGYGPVSGYGGAAGYAYGPSPFGGGFITGGFSGIGYGVTPLAPRNPWNSPTVLGIRGSPLPYGPVTTVYPGYMNGGVGVMGMATNGYNGLRGMGVNGKLSQFGSSDAQMVTDVTPAQINGGATSSKQNEKSS